MREVSRMEAIREFFGSPGNSPDCTYTTPDARECRSLGAAGYKEIGDLCAATLGAKIKMDGNPVAK